MESIDLSTENPLDGSFLNISLEETVHTTKYDSYRDSHSTRILRPLVTFADQIFFKIMNKQEYNELNLIISYFALLVSNGE
jgi:hypothetical protein